MPYVGYWPAISGLTNVFCADVHLGSQQAGENVQSVRTLCSFKMRAEGAFFMTLTWDLDDSLDSEQPQVAADCSGTRGVRQKAADSESTPSSSTALSRSSSRGEARLVTKSDRRSRPSRVSPASSMVAPTASFFTQPSPLTDSETEFPVVRVIYDFTPTSPFELAVHGQSACVWTALPSSRIDPVHSRGGIRACHRGR